MVAVTSSLSSMARERDSRSRDLSHDDREAKEKETMTHHTSSSDPKLLMSRVFIGKLPTDRVCREDVEGMFSKYGKILAISILRGYGFVQFGEESIAREAVKQENGSLMKGNCLDVKMAFEGRRSNEEIRGREYAPPRRDQNRRDPPRRTPPSYNRPPFERERDRSPLRERDSYRRPDMFEPEPFIRPMQPPRGEPPFEPRRREPFAPPPPGPEGGRPPARHGVKDRPDFDCMILVTTPKLRGYTEMIERRLKSSALLADHQVVADEKLLPKAVEDATRRGQLFAIILKEQNEQHHSLTLNILHGTPQEHRNMPLDDAIVLIARNYEAYMLELREKATAASAKKDFAPPDQPTVYLLNLLADSRFLNVDELDRVISYLQSRRNQLAEGTPKAAGPMTDKAASGDQVAAQQQELQKKILSILSGGENGAMPGAAFGVAAPLQQHMPSSSNSQASTTINFDNPNVQAALDNLISSSPNLLKNISAVGQPGGGDPTGNGPMPMGGQYQSPAGYGVPPPPPPGRGGPPPFGGGYGGDAGRPGQYRY